MEKIYRVAVYGLGGEIMMIDLCNTEEQMKSMTVLQLKEKIAQRLPGGAGVETLRLIFTEKMLEQDSQLLSHYGIQHLSVIHMLVKVPGGGCDPETWNKLKGDKKDETRASKERLEDF